MSPPACPPASPTSEFLTSLNYYSHNHCTVPIPGNALGWVVEREMSLTGDVGVWDDMILFKKKKMAWRGRGLKLRYRLENFHNVDDNWGLGAMRFPESVLKMRG